MVYLPILLHTYVHQYNNFQWRVMEYEKVLSHIGEFGRYQRCLCVLGLLLYACGCFNNMSYVFVSARPDHWCAVPPLKRLNLTLEERKKIALPHEGSPGLRGHGYRWVNDCHLVLKTESYHDANFVATGGHGRFSLRIQIQVRCFIFPQRHHITHACYTS